MLKDKAYITKRYNFRSNHFDAPYAGGEGGYQVEDREENQYTITFEGIPNDDVQYTISDDSTSAVGKYPNGKIPLSTMVKNKHLAKDLSGKCIFNSRGF